MSEIKPKSFRIDDETAEKFKQISGQLGGNQQETLAKLIESFEFQSGKVVLTEKKADIELFEKYVNSLTRMFMGSLEDNQNITETVYTEFDALLKSKDVTIQDLQEKLTIAKQLKEESTIKAKAHAEENSRLNSVIDSLNNEYNSKIDNMQSMLFDKDSLNKALTDSCNDLKYKVDTMQQEQEELNTVKKELDLIKSKHDELTKDKIVIEKELQKAIITHEKEITELKQHEVDVLERNREQSQLALDKAILEMECNYQKQIQTLKEQKQIEIDKYQQKYFELLESLKKTNNKRTSSKTNLNIEEK